MGDTFGATKLIYFESKGAFHLSEYFLYSLQHLSSSGTGVYNLKSVTFEVNGIFDSSPSFGHWRLCYYSGTNHTNIGRILDARECLILALVNTSSMGDNIFILLTNIF